MKINFQHKITFILLLAALQFSVAQKKDENIGTEVVNVVKPYTPTISDAFKVKETPALEDEDNTKKEDIKYNIFSFPVASTFTPSKGRAAAVDKTEQERLFKNYVTLGIGNYGNANAELFVTENIDDKSYVGRMLRHFSSQGGVKDARLEDNFSNTALDLTYGLKDQAYSFNADLGYQHQIYNWYGLPEDFATALSPDTRKELLDGIDPQHTYHNFYVGGRLTTDSPLSEAGIKYNRFWDDQGSSENKFSFKPVLKFDVAEKTIKTNIDLSYQNTTFEKYFGAETGDVLAANESAYFSASINPNFQMQQEDLTVNLGVEATYLSILKDQYNGLDFGTNSEFHFYPKVTASYKVVGDLMIAYAGAEGGLKQNSYRDFSNENQYLSPTLRILPTDNQYDIYVGLKGKLANSVAYNLRGSYNSDKDKALFRNTPYSYDADRVDYAYGNSFEIVYDNLKTVSFFGELKADFSKNVAFGINGTFSAYNTTYEEEAWNLPQIKLGSSLDVDITQKWYAGLNVFYVGERKDFETQLSGPGLGLVTEDVRTIDGYFDTNFNVGYKYSDRLTAFLKANNIANQAYEKWLNYNVQQFQVVVGASYKFDF